MAFRLTNNDKKTIEDKIAEIELKTQGEIVPCVLTQADNYPAVAPMVSLTFATVYLYSVLFIWELEPILTFAGFIISSVVGFWLGKIGWLKKIYLHPKVMDEEVHQHFVELFFENKLHYTMDRTGILIGISLLERRMEILAGKGIAEKVDTKIWDEIIQETIKDLKKEHLVDAILIALDKCGEILIKNFPAKKDNPNEISNTIITDL